VKQNIEDILFIAVIIWGVLWFTHNFAPTSFRSQLGLS